MMLEASADIVDILLLYLFILLTTGINRLRDKGSEDRHNKELKCQLIPQSESSCFASFALMPNALVPWGHRQSARPDAKPAFVHIRAFSPSTTFFCYSKTALCSNTHCFWLHLQNKYHISCPLRWLFIWHRYCFLSSILKCVCSATA